MNKILAVGSLAFDTISTPSGKADKVLGGSLNYFSLSASFFTGLDLVGVVGEDFPKDHFETLKKRGIDISGVKTMPGKTFHWTGEYGKDLNEAITLSTQLNVFEHFNPQLPDSYRDTDYLFLGNIAPELQICVLEQVKKPKLIALDSMNFWITGKRAELAEVLKRVDLLTINEGEAKLLAEESNVIVAAEKILSMGPKAIVIKRGEYGAFLFFENQIFSAPAVPIRKVVDPTGAGDTFAGGLVGHLAAKGVGLDWQSLKEGVLIGSVMASFTVEDFSFNRLVELDRSRIDQRLESLKNTMKI
ncbi:MAG: PfkB family carbohydrate kinase [Oligoflexia bacterium]|nr:PfkB family carbohydrate kinase [Oligoflexia bacterium]